MCQHFGRHDAARPASLAVAALFAALLAAPALVAQVTQDMGCAELTDTTFGTSIDGLGDVNGDGVPDLVIGAATTTGPSFIWMGETRVVSGATGATLWSSASLGRAVACAGDVDGDGTPDVATAATYPALDLWNTLGYVAVRKGGSGGVIRSWTAPAGVENFGWSVDGAGDVNGDGTPDIVVGAPGYDSLSLGQSNVGRVLVLSGATDGVLLDRTGSTSSAEAGLSVAGVGDINGDGRADVAFNDYVGAQVVRVVSGATGATLHLLAGPQFGLSGLVDAAGDANGDGVPDVLVAFPGPTGFVRLFSGLDGGVLLEIPGPVLRARAIGDASGDGVPEVATQPAAGQVRVLSGADGALLYAFSGPPSFGDALAGVGDVTGIGKSALAVGTPQEPAGPDSTGCARLIAFDPPAIASIEPAVVQVAEAGSTMVTLTGTGFDWATHVHVGPLDLPIDDPEVHLVGSTQITFTLPLPDALGPHAVTVSNATVESAAADLTYVETHPPTLSAPLVTGSGQPFAWTWFGGAGDTAVLLVAFSSSTVPVHGWDLLYPFTIVYLAPLDDIGAGGLAVTMPSLSPGLSFSSQVATVDGGLVGTSSVTTTFIAF